MKLFDFELVFNQIPTLLDALPVTLELALISSLLGLTLGLLLAIIKTKKVPVLSQLASFYISIIRGTPVLVQLYIVYFGVPMFFKWLNTTYGYHFDTTSIPGFVCAILALGLNESAYNAETIRAALQSVDRGQLEAASSIGMTYTQTLRRIIIPEAITVALPGLGNAFIALVKGTSLAFACAVIDLTARGRILSGVHYRYFETYVSLAIIYWVITIILEQIFKLIERKMQLPDQVDTKEQESVVDA